MTLDEMLAKPGVYEVTDAISVVYSEYFRVEVDSDLVCHQLTPLGDRDGVLPRDGWRPHTIVIGEVK